MDDKQLVVFHEHIDGRYDTLSHRRWINKDDVEFERDLAEKSCGFPVPYATMHDQLWHYGLVKKRY